MANHLKGHIQETIINLARLGWAVRRIAHELQLSRNTVRRYALRTEPNAPVPEASPGTGDASSNHQTDPLSILGSIRNPVQTDPLSTAGHSGQPSLCADYAEIITAKFQSGLMANGSRLPGMPAAV